MLSNVWQYPPGNQSEPTMFLWRMCELKLMGEDIISYHWSPRPTSPHLFCCQHDCHSDGSKEVPTYPTPLYYPSLPYSPAFAPVQCAARPTAHQASKWKCDGNTDDDTNFTTGFKYLDKDQQESAILWCQGSFTLAMFYIFWDQWSSLMSILGCRHAKSGLPSEASRRATWLADSPGKSIPPNHTFA